MDDPLRASLEERLALDYEIDPVEDKPLLDALLELAGKEGVNGTDDLLDFVLDHPLARYFDSTRRRGASSSLGSGGDSSGREEQDDEAPADEVVDLGDVGVDWDEVHKQRAAAFSEYVAKIYAVDPDVMRFRGGLLGDPLATLSVEEANAFVRSPAAHFLHVDRFRKLGIPPSEHEAVLEEIVPIQEDGQPCVLATIFVTPPGAPLMEKHPNPEDDPPRTFVWPWGGGEVPERFRVWKGSVLDQLQKLAIRLARKNPWTAEEAALFVLTGEVVWISPLAVSVSRRSNGVHAHRYGYDSITLNVAAWVPGEIVLETYRKAKRGWTGNHRQPQERNVAVFRFVLEQSEINILGRDWPLGKWLAKLEIPKMKELRRRWNEKYPPGHPWHYNANKDPDANDFSRNFREGRKAVTGTSHSLPGIKYQPMTITEVRKRLRGLWPSPTDNQPHQ